MTVIQLPQANLPVRKTSGQLQGRRILLGPTKSVSFGGQKSEDSKPGKKSSRLWKRLRIGLYSLLAATAYGSVQYPVSYMNIHYQANRFQLHPNVTFSYWVPNAKTGEFEKSRFNLNLMKVQYDVSWRIAEILQDRPDLRKALTELPHGGLEISLYDAAAIKQNEHGHSVLGMAKIEQGRVSMELAVQPTKDGLMLTDSAHEVICHELAHILDYLEKTPSGQITLQRADGHFVGQTPAEQKRFAEARTQEVAKLLSQLPPGQQAHYNEYWKVAIPATPPKNPSPLDPYALTNEAEFLAVSVEAFFLKPRELKASNPVIYNSIRKFFDLDPAAGSAWSGVKETLRGDITVDYLAGRDEKTILYMLGSLSVMVGGSGVWLYRRRKRAASDAEKSPWLDLLSPDAQRVLKRELKDG